MMKKLFLLLSCMMCFSAAARSMSGVNNPLNFNRNYEVEFSKLPTSGALDEGYGWPSFWWANNRGGIAHRWNSSSPRNFEYRSPSLASLRTMSASQINALSPAEKYDILVGDYSYPTVRLNWRRTRENQPEWFGICHGMSPASMFHKEPEPVTVTSVDGIEITFYSSDVKGLLGFYYARIADVQTTQVGRSCGRRRGGNVSGACRDVNAGAFHVILTNQLGILNAGFVADIDRGRQKWNHTPYRYSTRVRSTRAATDRERRNGVSRVVNVSTTVHFQISLDNPLRNPQLGNNNIPDADMFLKTYSYQLELNASGDILGGSWTSEDHPDFLWLPQPVEFEGYYGRILDVFQTRY